MRQMISGMVAAVAVMASAPAMACGYGYGSCSPCGSYGYYASPCAPPVYAAPVYSAPVVSYNYTSGCGGCGVGYGWVTQRLPDPEQQYYYVNQGPTYTGPGNWAPVPTYRESGVSYYRPLRPRYYRSHYRYGHSQYYHGQRVLRRYY
ncbi:hypothetical protein [Bradyrhizobium neotropicale]|uniref:hypothetical protein n=1 Tax=Bradyrhizobium neotropicale TaxID=1497615 RepID=UPI001AD6883A|nr:hypothetical protein [Bradyrhizobium neotropicale]MBO4225191.1 hypothetical protein [Bradyrhizobium neotropicale]